MVGCPSGQLCDCSYIQLVQFGSRILATFVEHLAIEEEANTKIGIESGLDDPLGQGSD
jgi:hypothetical protein